MRGRVARRLREDLAEAQEGLAQAKLEMTTFTEQLQAVREMMQAAVAMDSGVTPEEAEGILREISDMAGEMGGSAEDVLSEVTKVGPLPFAPFLGVALRGGLRSRSLCVSAGSRRLPRRYAVVAGASWRWAVVPPAWLCGAERLIATPSRVAGGPVGPDIEARGRGGGGGEDLPELDGVGGRHRCEEGGQRLGVQRGARTLREPEPAGKGAGDGRRVGREAVRHVRAPGGPGEEVEGTQAAGAGAAESGESGAVSVAQWGMGRERVWEERGELRVGGEGRQCAPPHMSCCSRECVGILLGSCQAVPCVPQF